MSSEEKPVCEKDIYWIFILDVSDIFQGSGSFNQYLKMYLTAHSLSLWYSVIKSERHVYVHA